MNVSYHPHLVSALDLTETLFELLEVAELCGAVSVDEQQALATPSQHALQDNTGTEIAHSN